MKKPRLQDISLGDLLDIRQEISQRGYFFSSSLNGISKYFLSYFVNFENIFSMSFEDIRKQFVELSNESESKIPNQEEGFAKFVCYEYLDLEEAPRYQLLDLHKKAVDQIAQIKSNIAYCNQKKRLLENNNETQEEIDIVDEILSSGYMLDMLNHYIKINEDAQREISDFILSNLVYKAAHLRAQKDPFGLNKSKKWYDFDRNPDAFDIKLFSDTKNKFLSLPIKEYWNINDLYKNKEDRLKFYQFMQNYIKSNKVPEEILALTGKNHYLNRRSYIIRPALHQYIHGEKAIFLNTATLQIEGLFYDYCTALGIPENKISKDSISAKLDRIIKLERGFYSFEYFRFRFPNIRNKIAHGRIMDEQEINFFADFVLLDLIDVSRRLDSEDLLLNKILKWIQDAYELNQLSFLIILAFAIMDKKINIPEFYSDAKEKLSELENRIKQESFFNYIFELIELENRVINGGIHFIMNYFDRNKFKEKRKEVFRKIQDKYIHKKNLDLADFVNEIEYQEYSLYDF